MAYKQPEFGQAVQPELSRAADDIVVGAQDSTLQLQIAAASFLVTLKEKYKITQSAVDYVVEGATNLIQQTLTEYATKVHHLLQPHPSIAEQVNNSISQPASQPSPDAKALKYQDPDIAYLLTSKFASISDDSYFQASVDESR